MCCVLCSRTVVVVGRSVSRVHVHDREAPPVRFSVRLVGEPVVIEDLGLHLADEGRAETTTVDPATGPAAAAFKSDDVNIRMAGSYRETALMQPAAAPSGPRRMPHRSTNLQAVMLMLYIYTVSSHASAAGSARVLIHPTPPPPPVPAAAVFKPGEGGYACYRAPSLTYTADGTRLLAIVEAYKLKCVSRQWCDIAQKVSTDSGLSFSAVTLVHGTGSKGGNASSPCFQNVAPTLDHTTGELFLPLHADFYAAGTTPEKPISAGAATVLVSSTDGGRSYSAPRDVSAAFVQGVPSMPGGTQLLPSGRLIAPTYRNGACPSQIRLGNDREAAAKASDTRKYCAYLMLSDTHGKHWRAGAEAVNGTECQVTTLENGSVLLNMRDSSPGVSGVSERPQTQGRGLRARRMALSNDGGETFTKHWMAWDLPDPCVEGSTVRIPGTNRLLFSHPSPGTAELAQQGIRANMSVFTSDAGGALGSWDVLKVVQPGPSAYSSLAVMPNKSAALLLYEGGDPTTNGDPCQGKHPCWISLSIIEISTSSVATKTDDFVVEELPPPPPPPPPPLQQSATSWKSDDSHNNRAQAVKPVKRWLSMFGWDPSDQHEWSQLGLHGGNCSH